MPQLATNRSAINSNAEHVADHNELASRHNEFEGAWTAYTPSWTSTGTQPALGNGTLVGRYTRIGRTIIGQIYLLMGSTTTFGTGSYQWAIPVAPSNATSSWALTGNMKGYAGGNSINAISRIYSGTTTLMCVYSATWPGGAETNVGQLTPWTWANGHNIDISFMYEAAS